MDTRMCRQAKEAEVVEAYRERLEVLSCELEGLREEYRRVWRKEGIDLSPQTSRYYIRSQLHLGASLMTEMEQLGYAVIPRLETGESLLMRLGEGGSVLVYRDAAAEMPSDYLLRMPESVGPYPDIGGQVCRLSPEVEVPVGRHIEA